VPSPSRPAIRRHRRLTRATHHVPVVVVAQREPADWVAVHPDAPFTFVTSKVPEAVEQARARAGEGHVAVTAGTIAGHCLELGLPDEVRHDLVPVVRRDGRPFFGAMTSSDVELDNPTVCIPSERVTHFRFPVRP